ncbi:hypothetical protein [Oscillibacter sp.]|nr:hypothetical protein [Oscillibacter sp.]
MFYLFRAHHWPLSELKELWEARDGWQEIIREFSAFECELRNRR